MEMIILSGGFGKRLSSVVSDVPKVMADVNGKPFLEYVLDNISKSGIIDNVIMATGYKKEYIKKYFGNSYNGINLIYSEENKPLGTGGAIKKALDYINSEYVFIINGDVYQNINYKEMLNSHIKNNGDISLALKLMKNFDRFGSVLIDENNIVSFIEKKKIIEGYMSVGCYIFNRKVINLLPKEEIFSIENDFFTNNIKNINFTYYLYDGDFVDIGIPKDYEKVKKIIR
jgi:D-glycero-alpha-D-manno-heptose 1-phosphate guanylyltransferase